MSCSRKLYTGADPGFLDSGFKFTGVGGGVIGSVLYLINCYFSWFS